MNKNLFEIGKNQYIVVNEENDMKIAISKKDGVKDILKEENDLEKCQNELNKLNEKSQALLIKNIFAYMTMFTMMPSLFLVFCGISIFPLNLIFTGLSYIPFKLLHIKIFDTHKKRHIDMEKTEKKITNLKSYITNFEKKLNEKKIDIDFKTLEFINYEKNSEDLNIVSVYNPEIQIEKPKILSLGQKK